MILTLNSDYSLNSIKQLVLIMKCGILFEVRTELLYCKQIINASFIYSRHTQSFRAHDESKHMLFGECRKKFIEGVKDMDGWSIRDKRDGQMQSPCVERYCSSAHK
jgi:hypothetical protein